MSKETQQTSLAFPDQSKSLKIIEQYQSLDDSAINFLYSGFVHVGLPHKRLKNEEAWQITTDRAFMVVTPGQKPGLDGKPVPVGVPFGAKARLIMIYLQTEALKTNNREIELGKSLRAWLTKMGISIGGKAAADVKMQAERISRCLFTFEFRGVHSSGFKSQTIVDTGLFDNNSSLIECVRLSESFFEQLKKHPVPIEEAAIKALNGNSMALDIYCWLAYRLHVLKDPVAITWSALKSQFGTGVARMDHFKTGFKTNLKLVHAVYNAADISITKEGMVLRPSKSPVSPKTLI